MLITTLVLAASVNNTKPIETVINAKFDQLVHSTAYVKSAVGDDKPVIAIFDKTFPKTDDNKGESGTIAGAKISADMLGTEGPIQIYVRDYGESKALVPCGAPVDQDKNGGPLIKVSINASYLNETVSCTAVGEYGKPVVEKKPEDEA